MNLDEMIQQCATDVDETPLPKTAGVYAGDELITANKFITGINFAYRKIAREKFKVTHSENVTLNASKTFATTALSLELVKIVSIETVIDEPTDWRPRFGSSIYVPDVDALSTVIVNYEYLPAKLVALTDVPVFPEGKVDHLILCYYGDFTFLSMETDQAARNRANKWLGLFNSGYRDIEPNVGELLSWAIE